MHSSSSQLLKSCAALLEGANAGLVVTDPVGKVVLVNDPAAAMFSVSAEALMSAPAPPVIVQALLDDAEGESDERVLVGGAGDYWRLSVHPLEGLEVPGHHAILLTSTMTGGDSAWSDRLKLSLVARSLPSVLHELRNPLASVAAGIELLVEDGAEDGIVLVDELSRIHAVLDGLTLIETPLIRDSNADPTEQLRDACRALGRRAESLNLDFSWTVDELGEGPLDPRGLRAVLFHLVLNSMAAQGSKADARVLNDGGCLVIEVADDGGGMSPQTLTECTRPFFSTRRHGAGLGLSVVKLAVEQAGGTHEIETEEGAGTRVCLRIPWSGRP